MKKSILIIFFTFQLMTLGQNIEEPIKPAGAGIIREEERRMGNNTSIEILPQSRKNNKELARQEKLLLTPSKEDYLKNSSFLKLPNRGIAKIFPDVGCNRKIVDAGDFRCLQAVQMKGFGAYYSFTEKSNLGMQADIYFADGEFSVVKSPEIIGFFSNLGNVPIESATINSFFIADLLKHPFFDTKQDLVSENEGIKVRENIFINRCKIKPFETYALRIINLNNPRLKGKMTDTLFVFRIIKENEDMSLTFLWRILQENKLIAEKNKED